MPLVCAFTAVCEPDARWFAQYLAETDRLGMRFVVHFDRCTAATKDLFRAHPNCVGYTEQTDPAREFDETHKQPALDLVAKLGFPWAMAWDVDETYCPRAPEMIRTVVSDPAKAATANLDTYWVNLWGDERHVRVDGPFQRKPRTKFYNLARHRWKFLSPVVNGAYGVDVRGKMVPVKDPVRTDITCLHWGMMTHELRVEHKERWDRIYKTATDGHQPYRIWDHALDYVNFPPRVEPLTWGMER